jgi:colanic acid/amylovoran biosynthesis glycosyltransferase
VLRRYGSEYLALFHEARCILGVSGTVLDQLERLGAPRDKLMHLPAFVNLDLFPYTDHSTLPARFLAVGRFAETKSPHLTLLAFQRVAQAIPEAVLVMAGKGGGGELFEACLILARALGLEGRVEFKGVLSHAEIASEMRSARVFVQHSVRTPEHGDMEGKPVAVMEAMASGMPVVTTRHSGLVELIQHEVTGFLVPEYDVQGMAEHMLRLAADDELVRRIGRNASAAIHTDPLISHHVEILEEVMGRIIAEN